MIKNWVRNFGAFMLIAIVQAAGGGLHENNSIAKVHIHGHGNQVAAHWEIAANNNS